MASIDVGRSPDIPNSGENRMFPLLRNDHPTCCFTMPPPVMPHESATQQRSQGNIFTSLPVFEATPETMIGSSQGDERFS